MVIQCRVSIMAGSDFWFRVHEMQKVSSKRTSNEVFNPKCPYQPTSLPCEYCALIVCCQGIECTHIPIRCSGENGEVRGARGFIEMRSDPNFESEEHHRQTISCTGICGSRGRDNDRTIRPPAPRFPLLPQSSQTYRRISQFPSGISGAGKTRHRTVRGADRKGERVRWRGE
jgi:hypothetical protein